MLPASVRWFMDREVDLTIHCSCTPVVDARYVPESGQTLTQAVVDALADAEGVAPTDLPPLYETIDPDALSNLFDRHDGAPEAEATLGFRFDTWNVFVRTDGRIRVCDGTRPTDPAPVFEETSS